jgi:hypothetical protein
VARLLLLPVRLVLVTVMVIACGGGHSSLFLFPKRSLIVIKPLPKRQWSVTLAIHFFTFNHFLLKKQQKKEDKKKYNNLPRWNLKKYVYKKKQTERTSRTASGLELTQPLHETLYQLAHGCHFFVTTLFV